MWIITVDCMYLDDPAHPDSQVGRASTDYDGDLAHKQTVAFRLVGDDGCVRYMGRITDITLEPLYWMQQEGLMTRSSEMHYLLDKNTQSWHAL